VAEIFKHAFELGDPAILLPETTEPMMAIADMEQNVWERLRAIVG
jgi:hypothetical protein